MELIVATWNIAGAHPPRSSNYFDYEDEDIAYFAEELKKISPDVVCLQETHINKSRSVAKELGKGVGLELVSDMDCSPSHIDPEYRIGNAIISNTPAAKFENRLFPYPEFPMHFPDGRPAAHHDKGFQVAEFPFGNIINLQMMPIRFFGTPYDSEEGKRFALQMEQELVSHAESPLIICGDFNYKDAEVLYENLIKKFSLKSALPDKPTRPDGKKSDYIFYSPEYALIDSGIAEVKADHYLCWVKLKVEI
ncbi:endonuclease/exonuclease/phosphatase family protein [Candidatus Parcubacteria bacterium]|nr:endonuclease/exonuclease/phosphatase family protein [Candidatus Parcubacteria bacterium]